MERYLRVAKFFIVVFLTLLTTSCAFKPKEIKNSECEMSFPKIELTWEKVEVYKKCEVGGAVPDVCFGLVGIAIPIGTAIYSGSAYLIGNTLSWFEYHGKCETGILQKTFRSKS